ncbi:hypothetical protein FHT21_000719 [Pedobacter sp. SG908]|nr:hypothetical protein [Pedobacter sp. SG908]NMN35678.1 hypothetical protein [Pedobacter sp. SG918]
MSQASVFLFKIDKSLLSVVLRKGFSAEETRLQHSGNLYSMTNFLFDI